MEPLNSVKNIFRSQLNFVHNHGLNMKVQLNTVRLAAQGHFGSLEWDLDSTFHILKC